MINLTFEGDSYVCRHRQSKPDHAGCQRFYQSHHRQDAHIGGAGIGLTFSKRLVEMHYGYVRAQSELHKGTTITIGLPIVKAQPITDQEQKDNDQPREPF